MADTSSSDLRSLVDDALAVGNTHRGAGRVASYIPALANVDPDQLGLAVATLDGKTYCAGDADTAFSIQSISKVFTLAMTLKAVGEALWDCVGREPSGTAFNSIVQLESEGGRPRNPLINAGAIATTDRLIGDKSASLIITEIEATMQRLAGDPAVIIDRTVAASEAEAGARNRSLAHFMAAFGNLTQPVETVLEVYFHQCALAMSCRQLACAGLFLANNGVDPVSGQEIISAERCRRINAVMMLCGHYDNSGEFAFRVGLPGKSGVGGGILAIAPGRGAAVAWSPGLNAAGTSLAGSAALEHFAASANWSVFQDAC
ncbi:MAG: glutaminase [Pseudomonadota bacterium]